MSVALHSTGARGGPPCTSIAETLRGRAIGEALGEALVLVSETFFYDTGRDFTGYEDGTESSPTLHGRKAAERFGVRSSCFAASKPASRPTLGPPD